MQSNTPATFAVAVSPKPIDSTGGGVMKRMIRATLVASLAYVMIAMSAGPASAAPNTASARGQCGGSTASWQQYVNNLAAFGAVQQASVVNQFAGYSPRDGSFTQWLKERVIVTRLTAPATITNYGCNHRGLFAAGKKHLPKGWPVLVALPAKYEKKDIRTTPKKGYKAVTVTVKLVGQATCTNPGKGWVKVKIYVKVKVKAKPPKAKPKPKPKPKPAPPVTGSCNVNNSPGAIVCSSFYVIVTCGGAQIQIGGSTKEEAIQAANQYVAQNCSTVVNPSPPCCQPPPPPPPPVCPPGTTGTWPMCVTPPPPPVTTTVKAITTHDVYSGGQADLCFTVSRSDNSAVDPNQLHVAPAEGQMIAGTLKFVDGKWCQRWQAPVTTVTHQVRWTAYAYGASDSSTMTVRVQDTGP